MHDGEEHAYGVKSNFLADNHVGNERSQNRAQYSGNTGHGYGQSYITLGHKGNDVGGSTAGAGAD